MADTPNSYKDPYWAGLSADAEAQVGVPAGLLTAMFTRGERSNHDQVSEADARTVFQITKKTRDLFLKRDGIDAYLNPQNSARVAALVVKDGVNWASRQSDDPEEIKRLAAGYYHAGGDTKNWGPRTEAYMRRVMGVPAAQPAPEKKRMPEADTSARDNLNDLSDEFSAWASKNISASKAQPVVASDAPEAPKEEAGALAGFGDWLKKNKAPETPMAKGKIQQAWDGAKELASTAGEAITGNERATLDTDTLPDWTGAPEFSQMSMAGLKTGLGSLLSSPDEAIKIAGVNFPGMSVRQDEKGNKILKSSIDGKEYAVKPGLQVSDIPRVAATVAAFNPAARVASAGVGGILKVAGASAATQSGIEGFQAAVGGDFDPKEVAVAGVVGGGVPALINATKAARAPAAEILSSIRNRGATAATVQADAAAAQAAHTAAPTAQTAEALATQQARVAALEQVPLPTQGIVDAAKGAVGKIGPKSSMQILASEARPDPKIVAAAKRLGVDDALQADQVSLSNQFRQVYGAVKSSTGSQLKAEEIENAKILSSRAEQLIRDFGGSTDSSLVNLKIKNNFQSTIKKLEEDASRFYGQVEDVIPRKSPAPAENLLSFLSKNLEDVGDAGLQGLTTLERMAFKALKKPEGQYPTYATMDRVRKLIGNSTNPTMAFKDGDTGLARKMYALISEDQQMIADAHGVGEIYKMAKESVKTRKGIEENAQNILGKHLNDSIVGDLRNSVSNLAKGDDTQFTKLISIVPDELKQEVTANAVMHAFSKSAKNSEFGPTQFAGWYEGLVKNKMSYRAVMSNLPQEARKNLSDIYRISKGVRAASREFLTTGKIQEALEQFKAADSLANRVFDAAAGKVVAGVAGTAVGTVAGPGFGAAVGAALAKGGARAPLIKQVDALLSSDAFKDAVKLANSGQARIGARRLARSAVFSNYVRALRNPAGMTDREKWILSAFQGQSQSVGKTKTKEKQNANK
jgi:hypothetical protein